MNNERKVAKYRQKLNNMKYSCSTSLQTSLKNRCVRDNKGKFDTKTECIFSDECGQMQQHLESIKPQFESIKPQFKFESIKPQFEFESIKSKFRYATPLNEEEYIFSKSVILVPNQTYNPIDLRGFFTHGVKNNIESFIQILKSRIILPRSKIHTMLHTGTSASAIDLDVISLATITIKEARYYKDFGERGITFITNKLAHSDLIHAPANMQNEFFTKQLNIENTFLLLDEKLKTLKIIDIPMLTESLNVHSESYKDIIKDKILFLIDEFNKTPITYISKDTVNAEEDVEILKRIYYDIIKKLFGEITFLYVVKLLLAKYGVDINVVFLNYL